MKAGRLLLIIAASALASACGTAPTLDISAYDLEAFEYPAEPSAPMIEHPPVEPVEPVEPPMAQPEPPSRAPAPAPVAPETAPPVTPSVSPGPVPAPVVVPEAPSEDHQVVALVGDLARYAALPVDDVRRELNTATQALTRQRTDANRVRLAMLYTLLRTPQDDARALQLLETISKSNPGSAGVKQLAGVMQVQVNERMRAVREEQQKAEAAIQKLEALRVLERNLMRDRLRSGGGGGGGGGSGSGGSGGGR
jgi:hypothetical protein